MKMCKNDGKEHIPVSKPENVSLEEALREIDKFPTFEEEMFIGFINERDERLQFIRLERDKWLIDAPVFEDEEYAYSLQDEIKHSQVKEIVTRFFQSKDWKSLCNLRKL